MKIKFHTAMATQSSVPNGPKAVVFITPFLLLTSIMPSIFIPVHANPVCSSAAADTDGDGWGWENHQSCVVHIAATTDNEAAAQSTIVRTATDVPAGIPVCSSASLDPDGDGWGWENTASCWVGAAVSELGGRTSIDAGSIDLSATIKECASSASDVDGDGFGWEDAASCVVASASTAATLAPKRFAAVNLTSDTLAPSPVAAASAGTVNGNPVCLTDSSEVNNTGFGFENNQTCVVHEWLTATRNSPLLSQRSCIPWLEIGYGNYRLQNNTWNDNAVFSDDWSQCIELTGGPGNYVARWDYNWLQRDEGNEYAVKSYPQVYYGRKTQYNVSGSVAETGLPVSVYNMPDFTVEYDYSESGIVERNVALESFFHTSCEAEEYNKQYEMMVWVGVPAIRTPGILLTTVTLSGQEWDVFINPQLSWAYVAFVAKQTTNRGTLDWNAFVEWSRTQGPAHGVPAMAPNACMGAIEIGSETFWGSGTFTLNRFNVTRR